MDESDPEALEVLDELSLDHVGEGALPDQCKGGVAGPGSGLDDEFPDVARPADDQNPALLRHRRG